MNRGYVEISNEGTQACEKHVPDGNGYLEWSKSIANGQTSCEGMS